MNSILGAYRLSDGLPGSYAPGTNFQRRGPEVLYKGMSSEKHFSPLERQKCFPDIQPPALAADLRCFVLPVVSCSPSWRRHFGSL